MKEREKADLVDEVMECLLDGDHRYLEILREQYHRAETDTEVSGSGLFVDLAVPSGTETLPFAEDFHFGDVEATMDGLAHGMGFVLFVRDGVISELEGYTYEEPFPETITNLRVSDAGQRDPETLFPVDGV